MAAKKQSKATKGGTCKRKSRFGHNLVKKRKRGSDGMLRTNCVLSPGDRKLAAAEKKKS